MTLERFLDATANAPDTMLRQAMVAALAVEAARSPEACRRFYDRVVRELSLDAHPESDLAASACVAC